MTRPPQIVAMGGGGFSMEPENPLLDDYVLGLAGVARPRVCFVPTASGDAESYTLRFYRAFSERARPTHLGLFHRSVSDLRAFLLEQDVVYVGGGNTASLLGVWRAHGLDLALRDAWQAGVILAGLSAGAICWFEAGVTDSFGPALAPLRGGLGFLGGSCCPHFDGEAERKPAFERFVREGLAEGYGIDDGCALHFVGSERRAVVASRARAGACRVERTGNDVVRVPLEARFLGQSAG